MEYGDVAALLGDDEHLAVNVNTGSDRSDQAHQGIARGFEDFCVLVDRTTGIDKYDPWYEEAAEVKILQDPSSVDFDRLEEEGETGYKHPELDNWEYIGAGRSNWDDKRVAITNTLEQWSGEEKAAVSFEFVNLAYNISDPRKVTRFYDRGIGAAHSYGVKTVLFQYPRQSVGNEIPRGLDDALESRIDAGPVGEQVLAGSEK